MRGKRLAPIAVAAVLLVAGLAIGLRGRGQDSPEQAIYALAHAIEHRDADEACRRFFSSVFLPRSLARTLRVPAGKPGTTQGWASERARCTEEYGRRGEFGSFEFEDVRVIDVSDVAITPAQGITRAAAARVALNGSKHTQTVQLVYYDGGWRVVFVTN